ncbi:hypothetical protein [Formosa sp. A9]|uniref:hypothetical protein n=1 Tax=Formosa sp. A9 TaxID=3442641 RepID=UPI003EBEB6CD
MKCLSLNTIFQETDLNNDEKFEKLKKQQRKIHKHVSNAVSIQIEGLVNNKYSFKNSQVYLDILVRHLDASDVLLNIFIIATQDEEAWDF